MQHVDVPRIRIRLERNQDKPNGQLTHTKNGKVITVLTKIVVAIIPAAVGGSASGKGRLDSAWLASRRPWDSVSTGCDVMEERESSLRGGTKGVLREGQYLRLIGLRARVKRWHAASCIWIENWEQGRLHVFA